MIDLCPHEMHPSACVTCATPSHKHRRVSGTPGPTWSARYDGACPGCPFGIAVGQQVRRFEDRVWHARCAEAATP